MERLDQTAVRALRRLLEGQPTTQAKVAFAWQIAAGPSLARAATLSWTSDGTLRVMARSEPWRQEIARARPVIAERIAQVLGAGVVRRIAVAAASEEPPSTGRRRGVQGTT